MIALNGWETWLAIQALEQANIEQKLATRTNLIRRLKEHLAALEAI